MINKTLKIFSITISITYLFYSLFILPEFQIPVIVTLFFSLIFFLLYKYYNIKNECKLYNKITYIFFSLFMIIGDSFKKYNSLYGIIGNPFKNTSLLEELFEDFYIYFEFLNGYLGNLIMILHSIVKFFGYYFIILYACECLKKIFYYIVNNFNNIKYIDLIYKRILNNKLFLRIFLFISISWLPYLIIKFPAAISADAWGQLNMMKNSEIISAHHPFFSSLFYSSIVSFWSQYGGERLGVFMLCIIGYTLMALIFSYVVREIVLLNLPKIYSVILLHFFSFLPIFGSSATTIVKDNFYSAFFVLFILCLIKISIDIKEKTILIKNLLMYSFSALIICLWRNNGIYVVIPSIFLISILIYKYDISNIKKKIIKGIMLILPIIIISLFNYLQFDILNIKKGSIKEALTIPFQQTARYVKNYEEEVKDSEKEIINSVLDYENLGALYNPIVSDPVKATYKGDNSKLPEYFTVWLKQLKNHPITYIEATLNTIYPMFYPDTPNIRAVGVISDDTNNLQLNGSFKYLRILLMGLIMGLSLIPIISCIINPVFYVWGVIYFIIKSVATKKYIHLVIYIPMIVQLLTVVAGPAVFNHPRYIYPIYWSFPLIICYLSTSKVLAK